MTKMAKRYAHFTLEAQRRAVEKLAEVPTAKAATDAARERPH